MDRLTWIQRKRQHMSLGAKLATYIVYIAPHDNVRSITIRRAAGGPGTITTPRVAMHRRRNDVLWLATGALTQWQR